MEPGGGFESKRSSNNCQGESIRSEPGELPCYLFVLSRCDCASIPPTTIARVLSTDAKALKMMDHSKRRVFAAEEEAARRDAERRAREKQKSPTTEVEELKMVVMEALSRGGYVACPKCGLHGQKNDACMHMTCPCGALYCYCCGNERGSFQCACDQEHVYLQAYPGWGHFAREGETPGFGALHEFHRRRMAYFLRYVKETHPARRAWNDFRRAYPEILWNVPTPWRQITWDEIGWGAKPPLFGGTKEYQLRWAVNQIQAANPSPAPTGASQPRQPFDGGSYRFGDMTKSVVARGKRKGGRDVSEKYKFGDFTRGLLG